MTITTSILSCFWKLATKIGMRRLGSFLKKAYPSAYRGTLLFFNLDQGESTNGYVALTIDDGLCRGGDGDNNDISMVQQVKDLLQSYDAHATFFVCTNYTTSFTEVQMLLEAGHELGNHLEEDLSGYYSRMDKEEFRNRVVETNRFLEQLVTATTGGHHDGQPSIIRWFRPPQGVMTRAMCDVIREQNMTSVLGDCYCDDWAFAQNGDTSVVAPIMLSQVQSGSIAIFHMPQRGFREASLQAIHQFLEGAKQRNLKCISLTEMESRMQCMNGR